jgi:phosphatidylserine decarboxylase
LTEMFPKFAHYGSDVIAVVMISCVLIVLASFLVPLLSFRIILDLIALLAAAFTLYFFRDPDRSPAASGDEMVISPADGKVVFIGETDEPEFLRSRAKMVSIFMSPANVHVNRIPLNGIVKYLRYIKGEYIVAFDEKSSERNERMLIGLENKGQRVLFKQIAGFIARRIVCELSEGQAVRAGERFGMIKFGSRVDVLLPMNCDVKVKMGEKTLGGSTILGVLQNE